MARVIPSLQKLVLYLVITFVLTVISLYIFHQFIATSISLPMLFDQTVRVIMIVGFSLAAIVIIRHFKTLVAQRIGDQAAIIVQYIMIAMTILIMIFIVFSILQVPLSDLLTSAGIISITAGLVISTFVGNILSGFLVFTNYPFKVGDDVMFNSIPGKIVEMTALVMRIYTDIGSVTIPNSAIASGSVILTAVKKYEGLTEIRLHYVVGDRVITSFMNEQGTVKELTPYHTVVLLDSGMEITFLNTSVLAGMVQIAKITQTATAKKEQASQH